MKGPSFFPTPSNVNWYQMIKGLQKFVNKLRFKARNILEPNVDTTTEITTNTGINVPKKPGANIDKNILKGLCFQYSHPRLYFDRPGAIGLLLFFLYHIIYILNMLYILYAYYIYYICYMYSIYNIYVVFQYI